MCVCVCTDTKSLFFQKKTNNSWVGRGMDVLDGGGDRRWERAVLGVNLWRPIATDGFFIAWLCESDELFPNYFGWTC